MLTKSTLAAIDQTWGSFGSDGYEAAENNAEALELVIDANRLTMNGFPDADAEVHARITEMGWGEFMEKLNKLVRLY